MKNKGREGLVYMETTSFARCIKIAWVKYFALSLLYTCIYVYIYMCV